MCVYKGRGAKSGLEISWHDYGLLSPEEYLNDTIIDFYLKFLDSSDIVLNQEQRSRCCFLSSFFWKLLARIGPEENYTTVFKWLRRFDIFGKDFVFVPICERLHWSLAVLTYPRHIGFEKEAVTGKQVSILYLDSFGRTKPMVFSRLRKCLGAVWRNQNPEEKEPLINNETVPGQNVKVPLQRNEYDCGLFMLHNVELLAKSRLEIPPTKGSLSQVYEAEEVEGNKRTKVQGKRTFIQEILTSLQPERKVVEMQLPGEYLCLD